VDPCILSPTSVGMATPRSVRADRTMIAFVSLILVPCPHFMRFSDASEMVSYGFQLTFLKSDMGTTSIINGILTHPDYSIHRALIQHPSHIHSGFILAV
jgi:hypothetical protein